MTPTLFIIFLFSLWAFVKALPGPNPNFTPDPFYTSPLKLWWRRKVLRSSVIYGRIVKEDPNRDEVFIELEDRNYSTLSGLGFMQQGLEYGDILELKGLVNIKPWRLPRLPIQRIYGKEGKHRTCYLTRIILTPKTKWGQLYLHIFHRGDADPDPHNHPWDFWTFPLFRGYYEEVWGPYEGPFLSHVNKWVRPWTWHKRPAEHLHRILNTSRNKFPLITLVWHSPTVKKWGFMVKNSQGVRNIFIPWREYVYPNEFEKLMKDLK